MFSTHIRGGKLLSCNKTTIETSQNSKLLKIKYKIFMLSVVFLSAQPSSSMTMTLILASIKQSKPSTSSSSWRLSSRIERFEEEFQLLNRVIHTRNGTPECIFGAVNQQNGTRKAFSMKGIEIRYCHKRRISR
jgi:hypothetical protein